MSIRIAFFDLDWTLYDHGNRRYVPSGLRAIKKLKKRGIKAVLTTARPFDSLRKFGALDLGFEWDGFITCSGGASFVDGKYLHKALIGDGNCRAFLSKCLQLDLAVELVGPEERKLLTPENKFTDEYYKAFRDEVSPRGVYEGDEVVSFLLFAPERYDAIFEKAFPQLKFIRFFSCAVDVMQDAHEKGVDIDLMLKHFGYRKDEAIGFGDDIPDISMAEHVGHFVCMGNGKDELKVVSEFVTETIDKDGLIKGLKHYGLV
ncbi:MAG: HAD hydrolase family protein [Bacilli bacterium]|jgi:Cof subfamily protein (haloacid dehalogenase superfamily)|nr:HAD hydrolase family protein [Bacilli bacterium]